MMSAVCVVVLNWNGLEDTNRCLRSLEQLNLPTTIIVVDNGSSDGSASCIRAAYPDCEVIETGANLGYAGGNNVGVRRALSAGAQYVCILNNDVIVHPPFLPELVLALESDTRCGIATPMIVAPGDATRIWSYGASIDWQTATVDRLHVGRCVAEFEGTSPVEVDVAPGSAMLIKREVFQEVGLLDEGYFLYYEEADWCIAARRAGYRIRAVPGAVVTHRVSAALGQLSPVTEYYMSRNRIRFIKRHWTGAKRVHLLAKAYSEQAATILAYTLRSDGSTNSANRTARVYALRDSLLGRWGEMGDEVAKACANHIR